MRPMRFHKTASFLLTSVTAGLAAAVLVLILRPDLLETRPETPRAGPMDGDPGNGPFSYAEAVSRAAPSVVNIYSTKITTDQSNTLFGSPLLQRMFGEQLRVRPRTRRETSLGSGVIMTSDGYVLTNNHIIAGADDIKVILADGRDVAVEVVGSDPETDVAVLRVGADRLPVIPVDASAALQVGDVVLAIGNPFGVGQTVTMGIVSATGRHHLGISTYENFIQTDAAINPGNSGGALINARGELVGINNAIFSQTGSSHGIGFAIPADLAVAVMQQLVSGGRVIRSLLGVTGRDVNPAVAEAFGLKARHGVLITGLLEDGPAEHAGLRPGDVITRVDGTEVTDVTQMLTLVAATPPASRVRIEGWRGNDPLDVLVVTVERVPQSGDQTRR